MSAGVERRTNAEISVVQVPVAPCRSPLRMSAGGAASVYLAVMKSLPAVIPPATVMVAVAVRRRRSPLTLFLIARPAFFFTSRVASVSSDCVSLIQFWFTVQTTWS